MMGGDDEAHVQQRPCKKPRLHGAAAAAWDNLPTEIVDLVLTALDDFDLVNVRRVCHLWRALADNIYRRPLRLAPTRSEYVVEMARRGDFDAVRRAWPATPEPPDAHEPIAHCTGKHSRLDSHDGDSDALGRDKDEDGDSGKGGKERGHAHCWDVEVDTCDVLRAAVEGGSGALVRWLCDQQSCLLTEAAVRTIVTDGVGQEGIEWLYARGYTYCLLADDTTVTAALAGMGHLDALDWLHARSDALWRQSASAAAAAAGHMHVVRWLREHDYPWDTRTCAAAAHSGHTDILWWAIAHGCPHVDHDVAVGLARNGLLDDLVRAVECGCPLSRRTWEEAAGACRIDILEWLLLQRCPTSDAALLYAAARGCIDTMHWLCARGASWHSYVFRYAARTGHLNVLQWASANGCPSDTLAMYEAACGGHTHVMAWLCDALDFSVDADYIVTAAIQFEQYHVLVWLRQRGVKFTVDALATVAGHGRLDALCWGVQAGFPFDARQCHEAVQRDTRAHRATKKWIYARLLPRPRTGCRLLCPADTHPDIVPRPTHTPWSRSPYAYY
ncbi:Ankyrin repeat domain containing protein [Pandoravirus salinus]|uniref:Ankyrin repeat domain containing protein n=1 Tax=Pandoravirus salinus TaxID=1349410 RepID=A0A291AU06_9VIRU|nr:ankyrin repeat domain [Pandoravirus salinus]ATE82286.1 Ankyrin repeat domain containing protein [Pandoravirus salinus]